ncbi:hypothetical protein ACIQGZ_00815 [Streptomyces sp. NPDC092296]|uniref:hypothetical protein n=1 Tax=Streptomyces sp. NPDC092296 TaxID=3366012 RepID=UPI003827EFDA
MPATRLPPRRDWFRRDGLSAAAAVRAHREPLRVLRADLRTAYLDAYSDRPWPPETLPSHERALRMGAEQGAPDPAAGIEVDVRDDGRFAVLAALAPYSVCAEARDGEGQQLYGAYDTGTGLCVTLTPAQEAALAARLAPLDLTALYRTRG